jgi:HSP20 family protein
MALIKWNNGSSNGNSDFRTSSPASIRRSLFDAFNYPFESVRMLQNLMDEDLGISGNSIGKTVPAVNISETGDAIIIEVAAPGMKKNDFSIEFHDNQLRIGYKKENRSTEGNEKNVLRREYSFETFERVFSLPESINGENISASYQDGILKIAAPKKEEAKKKPARNIEVR